MNRMKTTASVLTAMTVSSFIFAGTGFAQDQWQRNHPARTEVNQRVRRQDRRINQGLRHGQLNANQANQLRAEDQSIHNQEIQDAEGDHGHITGAERRQLNREENAESRQIYQDRH